MLLPSALPCDSRPSLRRFNAFTPSLFSPQPTPGAPSQLTTNLNTTSRALQSLLGVYPPPTSLNRQMCQLSTTEIPLSPTKTKKRVQLPPPPPSRGKNKRNRNTYEETENEIPEDPSLDHRFSTPKRLRRAPLSIPFGLNSHDFYSPNLHPFCPATPDLDPTPRNLNINPFPISHDETPLQASPSFTSSTDELSSVPEDREELDPEDALLVDLILAKLELSKRDWDECARALSADERSLGKRDLRFRKGNGTRTKRGDVRGLVFGE